MSGRLLGLDWVFINANWQVKRREHAPELIEKLELIEQGAIKQHAINASKKSKK